MFRACCILYVHVWVRHTSPQDWARTARDLMNNVFRYRLLTYFPGQCPLVEFCYSSPLSSYVLPAAGPGDFSFVAAGLVGGVCPARSSLSAVAGLAGVVLSVLPLAIAASSVLGKL